MTAPQIDSTIPPAYQVGDRVRINREGIATPGRISSIHRRDNGVEYVVRTDAADGGPGQVLNILATCGRCSFLRPMVASGETQ